MSNRKTLEQKRAANAWDCVSEVDPGKGKEYGSLARGLSAMIQTNGLGQTLAFLLAKAEGQNDKPQMTIYRHLAGWLSQRMDVPQGQDFMAWLVHQNSDGYRRATVEALAHSLWLRRFAEAKGWGQEDSEAQRG